LIYTKVRNTMAEVDLAVAVDAVVDGKPVTIRRQVRCEGGSTDADEGAKLRFTASPGWLVHDLGKGESLVLPVQGLCRAAIKAEWDFPSWAIAVDPKPDFIPLAMIVGTDGSVTAHVQALALASSGGRLTLSPLDVADAGPGAGPGAAATAQPPLPAGLVGTEFHYAIMTPVPRDLLAYYPVLARLAGQGAGLVPVEVLPPQIAFATYRFPQEAEGLSAWPDAGRIATPVQQHSLPRLTGLRRVGDRLVEEAVPGVVALSPVSPVGAQGMIKGVEIGFDADTPWRRLLVDASGTVSVVDFKTAKLPQ
jgi:hypothetical protein